MAHLNTAYKLGSLQAQVDFEAELNKLAVTTATGAPAYANIPTTRPGPVKVAPIAAPGYDTAGAAAKAPSGQLPPRKAPVVP